MNKKLFIIVTVAFLAISVLFIRSWQTVLAWQNPAGSPPTGGGGIYIEAGAPSNAIYIKADGNIGVGTTAPGAKLDVQGNLFVGSGIFNNSEGWSAVIDELGSSHARFSIRNATIEGRIMIHNAGWWGSPANAMVLGTQTANPLSFGTSAVARMTILSSGDVGIGTTTPGARLEVKPNASNKSIHCGDASSYSTMHLITLGRSGSGYGTVGDGYRTTTTAGTYQYDRANYATQIDFSSGNIKFRTAPIGAAGNTVTFSERMAILNTGTVSIGGGAGKLTVGTVDPIFKIDGEQYATYTPGMTGVKEETAGIVYLRNKEGGGFFEEIDFKEASKGSDSWVFRNTTDFGKEWANLTIILTPGFSGNVWYKKDIENNRILIYSVSEAETDNPEVSYRLTAPRFDYEKWSSVPKDAGPGEGLQVR